MRVRSGDYWLPFLPDAYFEVTYPNGDVQCALVEVDTGTLTLRRFARKDPTMTRPEMGTLIGYPYCVNEQYGLMSADCAINAFHHTCVPGETVTTRESDCRPMPMYGPSMGAPSSLICDAVAGPVNWPNTSTRCCAPLGMVSDTVSNVTVLAGAVGGITKETPSDVHASRTSLGRRRCRRGLCRMPMVRRWRPRSNSVEASL
jgi:hypothetical protein